jgi:hypothetical protein
MSRVTGRTVVPTNPQELEVLRELGLTTLRVPRKVNPFQVARVLQRATKPHPDIAYLRAISVRTRVVAPRLGNTGARSEEPLADPTVAEDSHDANIAAE